MLDTIGTNYFLHIILLTLTTTSTSAQTADIADWKTYLPLEIGNEWQFTKLRKSGFNETISTYVFNIKSDTTIQEHKYYIALLCHRYEDNVPCDQQNHYVRYDSSGAGTILQVVNSDSTLRETIWTEAVCGLGAPHGGLAPYYYECNQNGGVFVQNDATVEIGAQEVNSVTTKELHAGSGRTSTYSTFASGIGRVFKYQQILSIYETTRLVYARVNGIEYGSPAFPTSSSAPFRQNEATVSIFPNPTLEATTIVVRAPTAGRARTVIYDLLGREIAVVFDGMIDSGDSRERLITSHWAPGPYMVRSVGEGWSTQAMLVVSN